MNKLKMEKINFPNGCYACEACFINSIYRDKCKCRTGDQHLLRSMATDEILAGKTDEVCVDCPKINEMLLSGNFKRTRHGNGSLPLFF